MVAKTFNRTAKSQGLLELEKDGFIYNLTEKANRRFDRYIWTFQMGLISFHHNDQETIKDFQKYRLRIEYRPKKKGYRTIKVFIDEPEITQRKHFWDDGSLCLYKRQNFEWQTQMKVQNDLFPSICTWLYHYETWLETGEWYGEEAPH